MKSYPSTEAEKIVEDLRASALALAEAAHAGQVDKLGVPYIEHVRMVARKVAHLGPIYEVVGLLHDGLEDCEDTAIISPDILTERFGADVAEAVDAMTKRPGETYEAYLERVASNPVAVAVKQADIAHNSSRLHLLDPETRTRLTRKYNTAAAYLGSARE